MSRILLLLLFVCLPALGQQSEYPEVHENSQSTPTKVDQESQEATPPASHSVAGLKGQTPREESYKQGGDECPKLGDGIAALDLVQQCRMAVATEQIVLLTIIGIIFSAGGFAIIWLTLRAQVESTKAQIKNTEAMMMAERANLSIAHALLTRAGDPTPVQPSSFQELQMIMHIYNKGRSPVPSAYCVFKMVVSDTIGVDDEPNFKNLEQAYTLQHNWRIDRPFNAEQRETAKFFFRIHADTWEEICNFRRYVFVYGAIHYKDVFGKDRVCGYGYSYHHPPSGTGKGAGTLERLTDPEFWASN